MKFIEGRISIINSVDINELELAIDNIIKQSQGLGDVCNNFKLECDEIKNEVLKHTNRINRRLDDICGLLGIRRNVIGRSRKKRGLINIIGKGLKGLFGTMDSEDSEFYEKAVQALQNTNLNIQSSLKSQIVIMKSLNEEYKTLHNAYYAHETKLNEIIKEINNLINEENSIKQKIEVNKYFERIHRQILDKTLALDIETDILEQAILLISANIVHPVILKPVTFVEILQNHPHKENLLFEPTLENYHNLIQESKTKAYLADKTIKIIVEIPILKKDNVDLYEAINLPVLRNDQGFIFDIQNKYLFVSTDKEAYSINPNLNDCKKFDEYYVCKEMIMYNTMKRDDCVLNVYMRRSIENCKMKHITSNFEVFHEIAFNKYVFAINNPTKYKCKCGDVYEEGIIKEIGILLLDSNCKFITAETEITTSNISYSYVNKDKYDFGLEECINVRLQNAKLRDKLLSVIKTNLKDVHDLSIDLQNQESLLNDIIRPIPERVQGGAFIIALLITILLIYLSIKYVKCNKITMFKNCFNRRTQRPLVERQNIAHYYVEPSRPAIERPRTSRVLNIEDVQNRDRNE